MKNNSILAALLLLCGFAATAQDSKFKLGLRLAPNIALSRVVDKDDSDDKTGGEISSSGAGLRFSAGLTGDFYFGKNYAFMTGLWYTVKRAGIEFGNAKIVQNTQYLQVPVAVKLYTNEISTDMKMYFVLGGTLGVKIAEKRKSSENIPDSVLTKEGDVFSPIDIGLLLGAGVEYQMGENTILFGGITYNRGLLNAMSKKGFVPTRNNEKSSNFYTVNTNLIGLEVGIKF